MSEATPLSDISSFDLVVLGAGPAGYVAALRAAQLGLRVACVESRATPGGTCLNVGCIPSKALLESSLRYRQTQKELAAHGVLVDAPRLDLSAMLHRKEEIVQTTVRGVQGLLQKQGITVFHAQGRLLPKTNCVELRYISAPAFSPPPRPLCLQAQHILLATGSEAIPFPDVPFDGERILSSTEALCLSEVPKSLLVLGGGVIGLELGSVWARLGAQVRVVELADQLCGTADPEMSEQLRRSLVRQGLNFHLGMRARTIRRTDKGVHLEAEDAQGKSSTWSAERILVAIGRRAHTQSAGLLEAGIVLDAQGNIQVDENYRTTRADVYAVGDAVHGPMLAHKASEEGLAVVERLAGKPARVNYRTIPWVVYTWPELAWVGESEASLRAQKRAYRVGRCPFRANPRARTLNEMEGLVKLLVDEQSGVLLGAWILGPHASELLGEIVLGMEFGTTAEDIALTTHAHPSLAEALKEAALAALGRPLHL